MTAHPPLEAYTGRKRKKENGEGQRRNLTRAVIV
jgi:hypothetical protein